MSFFVIGVIWVNHHNVFKGVAAVDRPLMALNLLLLMFMVVFPFPTATLATYLRHGGPDAHVAAAAYGFIVEAVPLCFLAVIGVLVNRRLLDETVPAAAVLAAARRYASGAVAIAAAIGLALHMAIAVYFLATRWRLSTGRSEGAAPVQRQ
jgi:uncharacterized membrane protein